MKHIIDNEQLNIILETFEQYAEELSNNSNGTLFSEQWAVYEYLKGCKLESEIVGLDLEIAQKRLEQENKIYRITRIGNVGMIGTCDFNPDRLNLEVENNIIVNVTNG